MNAERRKRIEEVKATLARLKSDIDVAAIGLGDLKDEIESIRDEEQDAYDAMPEGLQGAENGQKLEASVGSLETAMDGVDTLITDLDGLDFPEVENALDEAAE